MFTFSFILLLFYNGLFFCADPVFRELSSQKLFDLALVEKSWKDKNLVK